MTSSWKLSPKSAQSRSAQTAMMPQEQAAFAGIQAARQAAMTVAVTIEVRDDAREVRQQAAAVALHGLAAGLKVAFLDMPTAPDPAVTVMAATQTSPINQPR